MGLRRQATGSLQHLPCTRRVAVPPSGMSDRSSTPILSPGAKCVEIGLLPDLAERVGRRARHVLVHPWRKPRPRRPVRERPCPPDRPEQRRIAGLSPRCVLHVGHVPELVDGHHSPSRSSRRRSRSASPRSRGPTVSFFMRYSMSAVTTETSRPSKSTRSDFRSSTRNASPSRVRMSR